MSDDNPWIEYREGQQFLEYIRKSELAATLEKRLQEAVALLWSNSTEKVAKYLNIVHNPSKDIDWYHYLLGNHIQKLKARVNNLPTSKQRNN